jgi:hypothetical protein
MTLKPRMICFEKGENDEIMYMFATPGTYIQMPSWPPPFTSIGRQGCIAVLKMTLSRG